MQTNAFHRMEDALLDLLVDNGVTLGISLDGPPRFNDRLRVTHAGKGSYERVMANVDDLIRRGYGSLVGGFLTVAQPEIPVTEYLQWVRCLPRPRVDVLWPIEFNHDHPPWDKQGEEAYRQAPRYGTWFANLFKAWWELDDPDLYIRLFYNVLQLHLGGNAHIDALVNDRIDMFVVNTDGAIEYPDYLRAARDGATRTPYTIGDTTIRALEDDPLFGALLRLDTLLPDACRQCAHRRVCGGGFLPGRTSRARLLQPTRSVLCHDQYRFFSAVAEAITGQLEARGRLHTGVYSQESV